ncbi:vancomycin high temperature exclusion protein [Taibaiella lutea]|uniref:Vancomycin high temperature exclusion protein n=1 Tax=Taibaiella lutea TaxID=2608001 RepID=A0A5M6CJU3_9BACT|nr:ElyC/SanA/YdcF family protein [Taibaiella lutea]KAA5533625.1 vancomycin high temperature exclusion protein [Taibaiella lutea]
MKRFNVLLKTLFVLLIVMVATLFVVNKWVTVSTEKQLYSDVNSIPHNKVGLVLGTSKHLAGGFINYYYQYRIDAAVALYKAGKIDFVLVSGDNGTKSYDEPTTMQDDLIAAGIPKEKIFMDYAGFRTLDSILRCKYVFGEDNITVISQPFHNQRAVFIANHKDVHAIAFNAKDVSKNAGFKTLLREKFARVKMLLDLVFNKQAKFYGQKVVIE